MPECNRILLTGAAGSLGSHLRPHLARLANHCRFVDRKTMPAVNSSEEVLVGDLANLDSAKEASKDCDVVVHFAGTPREQTFHEIMSDTLPASYNIYEASRLNGIQRIIFASSIHAVGYYSTEAVPDTKVMQRPVSNLGAEHIGFNPLDSSESHRHRIAEIAARPNPDSNMTRFVGGWFTDLRRADDANK